MNPNLNSETHPYLESETEGEDKNESLYFNT